jgi:hypothetical protein
MRVPLREERLILEAISCLPNGVGALSAFGKRPEPDWFFY